MSTYTTKRIYFNTAAEMELLDWCAEKAAEISEMFGDIYRWEKFPLLKYARENRVVICFRDGAPVGAMLSRFGTSHFDKDVKVLRQDLLYAESGTRAAKLLFQEFIDFGKSHADHIITTIGVNTNIKPSTLVKLGFSELETVYRIKVQKDE